MDGQSICWSIDCTRVRVTVHWPQLFSNSLTTENHSQFHSKFFTHTHTRQSDELLGIEQQTVARAVLAKWIL